MGALKTKPAVLSQRELEDWQTYSAIWKGVLTHVLEWPSEQVDQYIHKLRQLLEESLNDPLEMYGFFYDLPSADLFQPLLGDGLRERLGQCRHRDANPHLIYQRLMAAISGGRREREMEQSDFDWNQARERFKAERQRIEQWLASEATR